jgi:hypothetical protein
VAAEQDAAPVQVQEQKIIIDSPFAFCNLHSPVDLLVHQTCNFSAII